MRKARRTTLEPLHQCVRKLRGNSTPLGMTSVSMPHEQSLAMQQIALDIFADCSNRGLAFSDALMAVYLSGMEHGVTGLQTQS